MGLFDWIGRSVDELMKLGYPESVAKRISSGELPMDEASRMARAAEQGYDMTPEYRGGGLTQIEDPEALFEKGFFSTDNPSLASTYANWRKGGNTMPVLLNRDRTTVINTDGTRWNNINDSGRSTNDYVARVKNYDLPSIQFKDIMDTGPRASGYPLELLQKAFEPSNVTATLDPSKVRSLLSAAFDPEYTGPNILGSRIAPTAGAGLLGAMALTQSDDAEAGKLAGISDSLWWHGSDEAFRTFDPKKLGSGEGGRDTSYGFFFGKKPATAESYLYNDQMINPSTFEEVYGMSMQDAQAKADMLLKSYAEKMGITVDEALDWNDPKSIRSVKAKMMHPEAKQHASIESALFPSTYEFGARGKGSRDWLTDQRTGYLMGAELPSGESMKYVDMSGEAWDEGKQALIAKMARDEGYQGVVFQNMVDDAFSGSGADDIALVFDPNDINTRQVKPINMPDVDFSKLKSGALPTASAGALGLLSALQSEDSEASALQSALPMAVEAAGQSAMDAKPDLGRDTGTVLGLIDFLLPLVGEAFKPATMGDAELTDEQRRMRKYYGQ